MNIDELIGALSRRRQSGGDAFVFRFMSSRGNEERSLTWEQLDVKARAFAASLVEFTATKLGDIRQQPVVVALPTGAEFVTVYLGCLYAGAIAVPIRHPRPNRPLDHASNVIQDSGAGVIYTTPELIAPLSKARPELAIMTAADIQPDAAPTWVHPDIGEGDIAHLQYTSGSTSAPKGVAISYGNLLSYARETCGVFAVRPDSRLLSWLPLDHDLGLVFGLIVPLYAGCTTTLMAPTSFAQRPSRWLHALSDQNITHSAAPNFAYQACLSIPSGERTSLNLSALQVLINGAEPVRAETMAAFRQTFARHGLGERVLCPGYGMAENTLTISANGPEREVVTRCFDADALNERQLKPATSASHRQRELVACNGSPVANRIVIVDPDTLIPLSGGDIGEIWTTGGSVAKGYWERPELSRERFEASLPDDDARWLRTGDLGGVFAGDLFIIGRMDDMMVLRGINYNPEDIEQTVEACVPELEPGGAVVFAADLSGATCLAVVHEVTRSALRIVRRGGPEADALRDRLVKAVRAQLSEQHDLELGALLLLPPKGIPKTHTGKKQRHVCRRDFAAGSLRTEMQWLNAQFVSSTMQRALGSSASREPGKTERVAELQTWLRDYAASRLNSRLMDERRTIPPHVVMDFGNAGLLGMVAPQAYGGLGLGDLEIIEIIQQLAAIDTTLASFTAVNNALGLRPILRYGQPALIDRLMPDLAAGRKLASFAMTEADAGSNIRNLSAHGIPSGDKRWRLWGTKWWSGTAAWASVINTFVRLEGPPGAPHGVTGFVLEAGQPGLRQGPEALTMGLRAMVQNQVLLEGVQVGSEQRLGDIGDGMTPASDTMEYGRFIIAGMSLGIIKRALQLMARHAARRTIATGVLIDNPATRLHIAELSAAHTAIEALVQVVGARLDAGETVPVELYCALKTCAPEYAWRAADRLVQQLAGRGYIESNIAPQILRDARVLRIFEGPTEPMNAHIGARLVHMPEQLCDFVSQNLGTHELAGELRTMADEVQAYAGAHAGSFGGTQAAKIWAQLQIGETASFGILLACLRYRSSQFTTPAQSRALDWARARFERRRAKSLQPSPAQRALLERAELDTTIAGFEQTIGDIEQGAVGEACELDALLTSKQAITEVAITEVEEQAPLAAQPQSVFVGGPNDADSADYMRFVDWLKVWIADEFGLRRTAIDEEDRFAAFGMSSVTAQILVAALEDWLGIELPTTLIWEFHTVGALARHLASLTSEHGDEAAPHATDSDPLALLARVDQLSQEELEAFVAQYEDRQ